MQTQEGRGQCFSGTLVPTRALVATGMGLVEAIRLPSVSMTLSLSEHLAFQGCVHRAGGSL